jgi:hypothetical protein
MSFLMMFLLSSFLRLPCYPYGIALAGALPVAFAGALAATFTNACDLPDALARASHVQHLRHTCPSS